MIWNIFKRKETAAPSPPPSPEPQPQCQCQRRSIGQLILNREDERARRQPKDGHGNNSNAYEQLEIIKTYLEDLGRDAYAGDLSGLAGCCERVVRGKVPSESPEFKRPSYELDPWTRSPDEACEGLIANVMDPETAEKMVRDKLEDVSDLSDRFWEVPQIVKLMVPFSEDYRRVWFPYAEYWLFEVVACDRFLRPDAFDLE